jgi:hypothetical protein
VCQRFEPIRETARVVLVLQGPMRIRVKLAHVLLRRDVPHPVYTPPGT